MAKQTVASLHALYQGQQETIKSLTDRIANLEEAVAKLQKADAQAELPLPSSPEKTEVKSGPTCGKCTKEKGTVVKHADSKAVKRCYGLAVA